MAVIDIGLTEDHFFSLTPLKFNALCRRHRHRIEREEFMFGQLAATIVNTSSRAPGKPMSAEDFMPSRFGVKKAQAKSDRVRMTKKRHQLVTAKWRMYFAGREVQRA